VGGFDWLFPRIGSSSFRVAEFLVRWLVAASMQCVCDVGSDRRH
jgi:hypothetical protein